MTPTPTPLSIERIGRSKRELSRFFDVAESLYAEDRNWVAPLRDDLAKVFYDANPFFRHGEMQLFVVARGGKDVGPRGRDPGSQPQRIPR